MTDRRNRINEDLMEMLQMLKYSIRGGRSLDFSAGTSRPDIIAHLEHTDTILDSIPDDIDAYVQSLLSQCNVE
ncbi:hypothetical protein BDN72DRAFT_768792 [Pluteus cervinus]|uniref:Uncharacterized protein n=1 Tax=Pluteus cervinus TaxID=181527 RepID=A0ACD3AST4_9AGAR|nr:hypothetical protein BDN72DRAFT_768792 [Pluteus cervinus]